MEVQWKLPEKKDFYILSIGFFHQNRLSLRSNVSGGFGQKCRQLPPN